ncbi:glycoside hydrolase family 127 protein [Paenibacillus ginsengarvi]|uniref:Glycoside hydrolase family 127 protein n=1 Tax=Paenibacillus ginsengarvi TaxID=400777 RepID=A0A3B0CMZ7_9BACL|nr:beta-L-arabinofuranosidase domain-containing protein [Paenibacillus ginsengarvi]RKN86330.1 glycoside hydrolase family 127 protein [Paenibacillus ginsengarvi]
MTASRTDRVPLRNIKVNDRFWKRYADLVRETVIPYQWEALNDRIPGATPSYALHNFRLAAKQTEGEYRGHFFMDSDLAKWLEASSHSLATHPDPVLESHVEETVDLILKSQWEDGYVNTYFTMKEPAKRWTNLLDYHELYTAGHLFEAAVAYYEATGKRAFLDAMRKFADHIDSIFGTEPGKTKGYCGHQEIELALIKLYETTGDEKYARLSSMFIEQRGREPNFFIEEWEKREQSALWGRGTSRKPVLHYQQSHLPVREQKVAVGHAVRAVYMYAAMADLARLGEDESLSEACRTLWDNITTKQMYITGGIGSTHHGEAFTINFDLPNDTAYAETCASIGLIFFAERMLRLEARSEYANVMEKALYNVVLGSMSLDGMHYFYVNPLEVWPEACRHNPGKHHVKTERQKWFGCACCPPNVARLLSSLGQYIYSVNNRILYTHLYIGSETTISVEDEPVVIKQQSGLPWNGSVSLQVQIAEPKRFTLALRIPDWCFGKASFMLNGQSFEHEGSMTNGYMLVEREWADGDILEADFAMEPVWMLAHPNIRADSGKVALQRGPLVYCLEEADNGPALCSISVSPDRPLQARFEDDFLGGAVVITAEGRKDDAADWSGPEAYLPARKMSRPFTLRAVPYFLWGNRGAGEMTVWIRGE